MFSHTRFVPKQQTRTMYVFTGIMFVSEQSLCSRQEGNKKCLSSFHTTIRPAGKRVVTPIGDLRSADLLSDKTSTGKTILLN